MHGTQVIRALVAKRRDLLAELDHHRRAASGLAGDLEHVDGTIRLFTDRLAGDLMGALRAAGKPLSMDELAARVGIESKRVGRALRYLGGCGMVRAERALWVATY